MSIETMKLFERESREVYNRCYTNTLEYATKATIRFPIRFSLNVYDEGKAFTLSDRTIGLTYRYELLEEPASPDSQTFLSSSDHANRIMKTELASLSIELEALVRNNDKWNIRFLNLAKTVAGYSKDPSTKVGAVIVDDDDNVRTIGYNGFPRGVKDTEERLNDRSIKYPLTVHAELNAICTCARVGVPTKGATMVCTHFPCADCAGAIVQAGFKEVVVLAPSEDFDSRWNETNNHARTIFTEGNVDVIVFTEDEIKE